jgi:RNA polymerase sigma factor (sigma-70 family)
VNRLLLNTVLRRAVRLTTDLDGELDADLLRRFVHDRDESAFEELLRRHGLMVWGVCRQLLPDHADAEDAFQATFLALVRLDASELIGNAIGGWLHGVAVRVATNLRRTAAHRKHRDQRAVKPQTDQSVPEATWEAMLSVVHEEVEHLPGPLRTVFVLCDLEGVRQPDAAVRLGWKPGTLTGRLSRARQLLMKRLADRGLAPALVGGTIGLGIATACGAVPAKLIDKVIRLLAAGGAVSPVVQKLVCEVTPMVVHRTKLALAAILLAGGMAVGLGSILIGQYPAQGATLNPPSGNEISAGRGQAPTSGTVVVSVKPGETLKYTGKVMDKDTGKPIAGATVKVRRTLYCDPNQKQEELSLEVSKHTTDADGKYVFTISPEQSSQEHLFVTLEVEHPDYAPLNGGVYLQPKNKKLDTRTSLEFETVALWPAKPAIGMVKTPDGKPMAGVKILAYSITNKLTGNFVEYGSFAETRTDADGKFQVPLITPGLAMLWLLPQEYVPTTHVLDEKRGDVGTFTLETGSRLKGAVFDAKGKPLAGVIVNAELRDQNGKIPNPLLFAGNNIKRSAVTDKKGEFEMKPLPPGNYLLKPGQYQDDAILDMTERKKERDVPAMFMGTKVNLKAGTEPEFVEVRATPHVVIEAQYLDSKGKPTRAFSPSITGRIDGIGWHERVKTDENGKIVALVPLGLEETEFELMAGELGVVRWRKGKDSPLNNSRHIVLGTMKDDVRGIEVIRYSVLFLLVKITTNDGKPPINATVSAVYPEGKGPIAEVNSVLKFVKMGDGKFRSVDVLLPDEELTVTGRADGYVDKSLKVSLAENISKEIEIVLEKDPPAKEVEKKDK